MDPIKKADAEQLKKLASDLKGMKKEAQPANPNLKQQLLDAIPKANLNGVIDYFDTVVRSGFEDFEAEFDLSIVRPAIHKIIGEDKIDELLEEELWDDTDVHAVLAKVIWDTILGSGKNFIKFLYPYG